MRSVNKRIANFNWFFRSSTVTQSDASATWCSGAATITSFSSAMFVCVPCIRHLFAICSYSHRRTTQTTINRVLCATTSRWSIWSTSITSWNCESIIFTRPTYRSRWSANSLNGNRPTIHRRLLSQVRRTHNSCMETSPTTWSRAIRWICPGCCYPSMRWRGAKWKSCGNCRIQWTKRSCPTNGGTFRTTSSRNSTMPFTQFSSIRVFRFGRRRNKLQTACSMRQSMDGTWADWLHNMTYKYCWICTATITWISMMDRAVAAQSPTQSYRSLHTPCSESGMIRLHSLLLILLTESFPLFQFIVDAGHTDTPMVSAHTGAHILHAIASPG